MSQSQHEVNETVVRQYTVKLEAEKAFHSFKKAMATIRERYTKPGLADTIIEKMLTDKFGKDVDLSILFYEFSTGQYDIIVGRMHQADRARAEQKKIEQKYKEELIAEMTALYCGVQATAAA